MQIRQIWCFLFVLIALGSSADAATKCQRGFRVGMVRNEPLYYLDKSLHVRGMMLDVLDEVKHRTGCTFYPIELNRPAIIERLRTSAIDMTVLTIRNANMNSVADFIPSYVSYRAVILAPEFENRSYEIKKALADKSIIFGSLIGSSGYFRPDEIEILRQQKRIIEFPDYSDIFQALKRKQIKAFVGSAVASDYFLQKNRMKDFIFLIDRGITTEVGSYFAKRRLSPEDQKMLMAAYSDMRSDGTFDKILLKYGSPVAIKAMMEPNKQPKK